MSKHFGTIDDQDIINHIDDGRWLSKNIDKITDQQLMLEVPNGFVFQDILINRGYKICEKMLTRDINVNLLIHGRETLLHYFARRKCENKFKMLLRHPNIDITILNDDSDTVYQMMSKNIYCNLIKEHAIQNNILNF